MFDLYKGECFGLFITQIQHRALCVFSFANSLHPVLEVLDLELLKTNMVHLLFLSIFAFLAGVDAEVVEEVETGFGWKRESIRSQTRE